MKYYNSNKELFKDLYNKINEHSQIYIFDIKSKINFDDLNVSALNIKTENNLEIIRSIKDQSSIQNMINKISNHIKEYNGNGQNVYVLLCGIGDIEFEEPNNINLLATK